MTLDRSLHDSPTQPGAGGFTGDDVQTVDDGVTLLSNRRLFGDLVARAVRDRSPGGTLPVALIDGELDATADAVVAYVAAARGRGEMVAVVACSTDPIAAACWVEAGANAVLTRETPLVEMIDVVERLAVGEVVLGVAVREGLLSQLRSHRQARADRDHVFLSLTKREREVLTALAFGSSPEDIARNSYVSMNTVRTQIRNVLGKLGVASVAAAVAMAHCSRWFDDQLP